MVRNRAKRSRLRRSRSSIKLVSSSQPRLAGILKSGLHAHAPGVLLDPLSTSRLIGNQEPGFTLVVVPYRAFRAVSIVFSCQHSTRPNHCCPALWMRCPLASQSAQPFFIQPRSVCSLQIRNRPCQPRSRHSLTKGAPRLCARMEKSVLYCAPSGSC
jgi:hypothetical protein